jgi:hypothetical protein
MQTEPVVPILLSAPLLAMFTMEILKFVVRKWVVKDPTHDFPPLFYNTLIPFFTGLWGYILAYVGWGEPVSFDLVTLLQWALASVITVIMYQFSLSPMKTYAKDYRDSKS